MTRIRREAASAAGGVVPAVQPGRDRDRDRGEQRRAPSAGHWRVDRSPTSPGRPAPAPRRPARPPAWRSTSAPTIGSRQAASSDSGPAGRTRPHPTTPRCEHDRVVGEALDGALVVGGDGDGSAGVSSGRRRRRRLLPRSRGLGRPSARRARPRPARGTGPRPASAGAAPRQTGGRGWRRRDGTGRVRRAVPSARRSAHAISRPAALRGGRHLVEHRRRHDSLLGNLRNPGQPRGQVSRTPAPGRRALGGGEVVGGDDLPAVGSLQAGQD